MDKFYAFARYFLNETFSFLLHKNWNPELILAVVKVLSIRAARFLLNEQNTLEEVESEESEDSDNSDESESEDSDGDMRMQRKLKPKNIVCSRSLIPFDDDRTHLTLAPWRSRLLVASYITCYSSMSANSPRQPKTPYNG